jgi:predicted CopG family antitoxin
MVSNLYTTKELLDMLSDSIDNLRISKEMYYKMFKEAQEDIYKDKVIAELNQEKKNAINHLRRGFGISEQEEKYITEWKDKHKENCNSVSYKYIFTPTPIGTVGEVCCIKCNKKFTFRDIG